MSVLSSSEVWHVLLGLLNVGQVKQETASRATQVSGGLVSVQMTIPLCLELEHLVSQSSTLYRTIENHKVLLQF